MEGNQMKMREALEKLVEIIDKYDGSSPLWWHCGAKGVMPLKNAKAALALPPRNCDVGTAEEQIKRFDRECLEIRQRNTVEPCGICPCSLHGEGHEDCQLLWAQMPYEAEEGGAK